MITEAILLKFCLLVGFVIAPLMTNRFFLDESKIYRTLHKGALVLAALSFLPQLSYLSLGWLLFCGFGFGLYLKSNYKNVLARKGLLEFIPLTFSMISSTWFVAGSTDLALLGYNQLWSFYAALHGIFLGWLFVGSLVILSKKDKLYFKASILSFVLFLLVAYGIDGVPFIKRIGVIGFSILVPLAIGRFMKLIKNENRSSYLLSLISLSAIVLAMLLALLNEFWLEAPKTVFGISLMVLTHGFINALITVPCFYFAVSKSQKQN